MKRTIFIMALLAMAPLAMGQTKSGNGTTTSLFITDVAPTGQTLYYRLLNHTAYAVNPMVSDSNNMHVDTNYVVGDLRMPDTVFYNGEAYPVIMIEDFAFWGCRGMTSLVISNHMWRICSNAFCGCTGMRSVSIPNTVVRLEPCVFAACTSLDSVTIPPLVTKIEQGLFEGCSSLTHVDIHEGVTEIQASAFARCTSLQHIELPDTINYIPRHAFDGCSSLTMLPLKPAVTRIDEWAFNECTSLGNYTIPANIEAIGYMALCNTGYQPTIYLKPTTPPAYFPYPRFYMFPPFSTLVVPHNSYQDYVNWSDSLHYYLYCDTIYLNSNSAKSEWGHIVGCDTLYAYPYDSIRLEAVPNPGYVFTGWEDGSTDPVRYVVGLHHDSTFVATFVDESTVAVEEVEAARMQVSAKEGRIVVKGATDEVHVYDTMGREVARAKGESLSIEVPQTGVYILRSGTHAPRKVVVTR